MTVMKIVVVEDNPTVRRLLKRRVQFETGATVVGEAAGEDEAVQAVTSTSPDAVLLDLHLEQGCGLNALKRMRRQGFHAPVLVLSAHDRAAYAPLVGRSGGDGFYDKAFDLERLFGDLQALWSRLGQPRRASVSAWSR